MGVLLREGYRFLKRLTEHIAGVPELNDALVEGVLFTIRNVQSDENLALLFAPETAGITTSVPGASEALFGITAEFLRPFFEAARANGTLRACVDVDEAAEWVLRAILSLVSFDGLHARDDAAIRSFIRCFLVPAILSETVEGLAPQTRARRRTPLRAR